MEYAYKKLNIPATATILDPFLGSGTTCVYAKEQGNPCYGRDVNEVALLASRVKTYDYEITLLKESLKKIYEAYPKITINKDLLKKYPDIVRKAFPLPVLMDLLKFKNAIETAIEKQKYKEFFILALMNTSTICTYAEKHGGSIRINKHRKFPPVKIKFKQIAKKMISDLEKVKFKGSEAQIDIRKEDARFMKSVPDEEVNFIITSPPYLNKIEYTNVYAIEQYLFISPQYSKPAVRSFIGETLKKEVEDVFKGRYALNTIAKAYFKDMKQVVKEMARVLVPNGKGAVVIGQGCFPDGVIKSDELLAELMEEEGLEVFEIEVGNERWCMRNRTRKVGIMQENVIWFKKVKS
ncbi:MAG: site-specific DNA-methyltransferase [Candidatus Nanohaloarchaeota archaeon]|nr:site-specific DNA-methyltransferase [Candidatus Nanohaloarchaeota archaeon]